MGANREERQKMLSKQAARITKARTAREKRDATISKLRSKGWTLEQIADEVDVTPQRVGQILLATSKLKKVMDE